VTIALILIVSCEVLGLTTPFVGSCWGHAMFKCCQHAIDDFKICVNLAFISIEENNPFCKNLSHGPKEWEHVTRVAQGMFEYQCAPMEAQDFDQNYICLFLKSFCFKRFWNLSTPLLHAMEDNNN